MMDGRRTRKRIEELRAASTKPAWYYRASPTLKQLHRSGARRRGVRGPIGSGKSHGCCYELFRLAVTQRPNAEGVRRTRMLVVRNTYRELVDTTRKTWVALFGRMEEFERQDMTSWVRVRLGDGTLVECEILWRSLDRPADVAKLLSLEITAAWLNEAREMPLVIVQAVDDRIGRYPPASEEGCSHPSLIMDTNPPAVGAWWHLYETEERPEGWDWFVQPAGLLRRGNTWVSNPAAENAANLEQDFYEIRAQGKSDAHISVYYGNNFGIVSGGKPVFREYSDTMHVVEDIPLIQSLPIYTGWDGGLTPAWVLVQMHPSGQMRIIDEFVAERAGIESFGASVTRHMSETWGVRPDACEYHLGDPSMAWGKDTEEREHTAFGILESIGWQMTPGIQSVEIRLESVRYGLTRLTDHGPMLVISSRCRMLRRALGGEYRYRQLAISGGERYAEKPDKGPYSHVADALQYVCAHIFGPLLGRDGNPYGDRAKRSGAAGGQYARKRGGVI